VTDQSRDKSNAAAMAIIVIASLYLIYLLRYVLLPFVAAGALAYLSRPLMYLLCEKMSFPRWLAALATFLLFLAIVAFGVWAVERLALPQFTRMMSDLPGNIEKFLQSILRGREIQLPGRRLTAHELAEKLNLAVGQLADSPLQIVGTAAIGSALLMGGVMTCALFAFFLFTAPRLTKGTLWLVPPAWRPQARSLAMQIDPLLARYLTGVLIIVLFTSAMTFIATALLFHVPHVIFLSLMVGLLELIPVIGPILSFVTFGLVAVEQAGFGAIVGFGIFAIALRLAIDQLVGPLVLGKAARIPAVVVMFSFLAGGALYGMLGVILAIPAAATIKIVLAEIYQDEPESFDSA
jgi:predicted PurR-regulated permease PerM